MAPKAAAVSSAAVTPPAPSWQPGSLLHALVPAYKPGALLHAIEGQVQGYKPTAQASQFAASGVDVAPTVAGMINAYAEGQSLEYTVTAEPLNGTVTIDDSGSFVYTPDPNFAEIGGGDVFTVKVTNTARTLLNLFGVPGLSTDVMVPVTMAPVDNAALTAATSSSTANYTIFNQTYRPVVIDGYLKYDGVISGAAIGTVLAPAGNPGSSASWLLNEQGEHQQVAVHMSVVDNPELAWWVEFQTKPSNGSGHDTTACSGNSGGVQCSTDGYQTAWLMDPAGTTVTVPAADAQQQSDYLFSLCDSSFSNCKYTYKTTETNVAYTNPLIPDGFNPIVNLTSTQVWYQQSWQTSTTDTSSVTQTGTVGVSVTGGQKDVMSATVSASYSYATGKSIATASTYTQTLNIYAQPGETLYLYSETPNLLQYGDWTLSYGATTYNLQDVWYLSPSSGGPAYFVPYTCSIGSDECTSAAIGYQQNPVVAPTSVTAYLPTPSYVLD